MSTVKKEIKTRDSKEIRELKEKLYLERPLTDGCEEKFVQKIIPELENYVENFSLKSGSTTMVKEWGERLIKALKSISQPITYQKINQILDEVGLKGNGFHKDHGIFLGKYIKKINQKINFFEELLWNKFIEEEPIRAKSEELRLKHMHAELEWTSADVLYKFLEAEKDDFEKRILQENFVKKYDKEFEIFKSDFLASIDTYIKERKFTKDAASSFKKKYVDEIEKLKINHNKVVSKFYTKKINRHKVIEKAYKDSEKYKENALGFRETLAANNMMLTDVTESKFSDSLQDYAIKNRFLYENANPEFLQGIITDIVEYASEMEMKKSVKIGGMVIKDGCERDVQLANNLLKLLTSLKDPIYYEDILDVLVDALPNEKGTYKNLIQNQINKIYDLQNGFLGNFASLTTSRLKLIELTNKSIEIELRKQIDIFFYHLVKDKKNTNQDFDEFRFVDFSEGIMSNVAIYLKNCGYDNESINKMKKDLYDKFEKWRENNKKLYQEMNQDKMEALEKNIFKLHETGFQIRSEILLVQKSQSVLEGTDVTHGTAKFDDFCEFANNSVIQASTAEKIALEYTVKHRKFFCEFLEKHRECKDAVKLFEAFKREFDQFKEEHKIDYRQAKYDERTLADFKSDLDDFCSYSGLIMQEWQDKLKRLEQDPKALEQEIATFQEMHEKLRKVPTSEKSKVEAGDKKELATSARLLAALEILPPEHTSILPVSRSQVSKELDDVYLANLAYHFPKQKSDTASDGKVLYRFNFGPKEIKKAWACFDLVERALTGQTYAVKNQEGGGGARPVPELNLCRFSLTHSQYKTLLEVIEERTRDLTADNFEKAYEKHTALLGSMSSPPSTPIKTPATPIASSIVSSVAFFGTTSTAAVTSTGTTVAMSTGTMSTTSSTGTPSATTTPEKRSSSEFPRSPNFTFETLSSTSTTPVGGNGTGNPSEPTTKLTSTAEFDMMS